MGRTEIIAAGPHFGNGVQCQVLIINDDTFQDFGAHADDFVVHDVLLVSHRQHGFQHSRSVMDIIGSAHCRQEGRHGFFPTGLGIGDLGIGQSG